MIQTYARPLADPQASIETLGGKGASIARLAVAGFPVPNGFQITTAAYRRFVSEQGLQDYILETIAAVNLDEPATLENASMQIGQLFVRGTIPEDIAEAICRAR
jgi:pyruvate,water dikinase